MTGTTLNDRAQTILNAVVAHYIKSARPVASGDIIGDLDLGLSSATVRNQMLQLDELGYLEQPHTSAGRIPTDRAYRFFVDHLQELRDLSEREQELIEDVLEYHDEGVFVRELCRTVARLAGTYVAGGLFEEDVFHAAGFAEILEEPEFHDAAYVRQFGRLVDLLEEELRTLALLEAESEENHIKIYIGKENPLKDARSYAMMIVPWQHPRGFEGFLTLVGPTRTNYSRHRAIMENISTMFDTNTHP